MDYIKALFEQPKKFENLLFYLSQVIVSAAILQHLLPEWSAQPNSTYDLLSLQVFKDNSLQESSIYIVALLATWFVIWYIAADIIIVACIKLTFGIPGFVFRMILKALGFLVFGIRFILAKIRKRPLPFKFWLKPQDSAEDEYSKFLQEHQEDISVFNSVDKNFNIPLGSFLLLTIIEKSKSQILRSRIINYYGVFTTLYILHLNEINFEILRSGIEITSFVGMILLTVIIYAILEGFNLGQKRNVRSELPRLEYNIYNDMVKSAVKTPLLFREYDKREIRKGMRLKLKEGNYSKNEVISLPNQIEIIPLTSLELIIGGLNRRPIPDGLKVIVVSNRIPDLPTKTLFEKLDIGFIYAENEDEVERGSIKYVTMLKDRQYQRHI